MIKREAPQPDEVKLCIGCGAVVRRKIMKTAKFCSGSCRNLFHIREYRKRQAIKAAEPKS